jgi:hypothetical protein
MNQTPVKVRRKFDETFKRAALENWHNSGKSATVIAQELGLEANRLYAWPQRFATLAVNIFLLFMILKAPFVNSAGSFVIVPVARRP